MECTADRKKATQERLERHLGTLTHPEEGRAFLDGLRGRNAWMPEGFAFRVEQKIRELEKEHG